MSNTIDATLRQVFSQVLGVPADGIGADASPETIPTWDSLTHVSLMMAIEAECDVQFEPTELMELKSYGAILTRITAGSGA